MLKIYHANTNRNVQKGLIPLPSFCRKEYNPQSILYYRIHFSKIFTAKFVIAKI